MSSPLAPIFPYVNTLVFFAAYTVLYKNNPLYRGVTNLVIGISAGYLIASNIDAFYRGVVIDQMTNGLNIQNVLAWVIGVLFVFVFFPKLISLYRAAAILVMTVGIGMQLPYGPATFWTLTVGYAKNMFNFVNGGFNAVTIGALAAAIAYVLGMSYFFFTDKADKPTAPFRKGGRIVLLIYAAFCIVQTALGMINIFQWKLLEAINGVPTTWYIPIGLFLLILVDAFVFPLRKLIPGTSKVEAKTS
jgi:hypothetical protein